MGGSLVCSVGIRTIVMAVMKLSYSLLVAGHDRDNQMVTGCFPAIILITFWRIIGKMELGDGLICSWYFTLKVISSNKRKLL